MGPFRPWDDISHVPATLAGTSAAAANPQTSHKLHANANAKKQPFLFIDGSPLSGY
jgi:hypothetical protein